MKSDSEEEGEIGGLKLISFTNKDKYVLNHLPYSAQSDFELGFMEAMDFLQYVGCHFSIAMADELWPPKSKYDKEHAYEILKDGSKLLVYNHFWSKYVNEVACHCGNKMRAQDCPYKFYNSLDYNNRRVLYQWYKRNITDNF